MTPERKELIDEGKHHEDILSGDRRGDPVAVSDAVSYLIRCLRTQLYFDCVTIEDCIDLRAKCPGQKSRFGWPACVALVTVLGVVVGLIHRFTG